MPPERPITTSAKPFLRTKSRVPSTSASHTSAISDSRGATPTGSTAGREDGRGGQGPDDREARSRGCLGDLDVDDHEALGELGGPGDDGAVGGDDHGVAVEDELVLTADLVDVGDGGAGLGGPVADDGEAGLGLAHVVRRGVEVHDETGAAAPQLGDRAVGGPGVLADRHADGGTRDRHERESRVARA